jgi:hypothetical protein
VCLWSESVTLSNLGGTIKRSVNMNMTWQSTRCSNTWLSTPHIFLNQPSLSLRVSVRVYTLYPIYNVTSTYWYAAATISVGQSTNIQPSYLSTTRLASYPLPRALKRLDSGSSEVEVPPSRSGKLVSRLSKYSH